MQWELTRVAGKDALIALAKLRTEAAAKGQCAFLIGDPKAEQQLAEVCDSSNFEETLKLGQELDIDEWFEERTQERLEDREGQPEDDDGEWPGELAHGGLSLHLSLLSRKPLNEVVLATVPVAESWQIPAWLGLGGWNECPDAVVQTAIARRWGKTYQAELVGVSGEVLEWEVKAPPRTQQAAMKLAREQFLFCEDIVSQGVETLSNLGGVLLNSPYWYFWWD